MHKSKILSVIIFGSTARGERDVYSDIDVCVIIDGELDGVVSINIKQDVSLMYGVDQEEIVVYSPNQIDQMLVYRSLFLWHLKLEGNVLFDNGYFKKIANKLLKYDKHLIELNYHAELLGDIISYLNKFNIVSELDLSQLFTICRNSCMILAHYNNEFAFGRNSAFEVASRIYNDLPISRELYQYLMNWKLIYERGIILDLETPSIRELMDIITTTKRLLYFSIEKVSI